jgi:hypothetical protein
MMKDNLPDIDDVIYLFLTYPPRRILSLGKFRIASISFSSISLK